MRCILFVFCVFFVSSNLYAEIKFAKPIKNGAVYECPSEFVLFNEHCVDKNSFSSHSIADICNAMATQDKSLSATVATVATVSTEVSNSVINVSGVYKTRFMSSKYVSNYGIQNEVILLDNGAAVKSYNNSHINVSYNSDIVLLYRELGIWYMWCKSSAPVRVDVLQYPKRSPEKVSGVTDLLRLID